MTDFRTVLPLAGKEVLVVGAGPGALSYIARLCDADAIINVVAETATDALHELIERGQLTLQQRPLAGADISDAWLVIAASGDPDMNKRVESLAADYRRLCIVETPAAVSNPNRRGVVVLVGGGPGDEGLLTIRGMNEIQAADVIVVDRLAPLAALDQAAPGTEIIDVSKVPRGPSTPQEAINELLISHARKGKRVVRLKGGDNFVFGRGGEEWEACVSAGVEVQVVPGVSSSIAAPALAGIPVTHRTLTQGFTVVSGHVPPGDPRSTLDWAAVASTHTTIVILMGVANIGAIAQKLIDSGLPACTPSAAVSDGGKSTQVVVRAQLSDIAKRIGEIGLNSPAVIVVGAVAGFDPESGRG